jgi:hypothetical protein
MFSIGPCFSSGLQCKHRMYVPGTAKAIPKPSEGRWCRTPIPRGEVWLSPTNPLVN